MLQATEPVPVFAAPAGDRGVSVQGSSCCIKVSGFAQSAVPFALQLPFFTETSCDIDSAGLSQVDESCGEASKTCLAQAGECGWIPMSIRSVYSGFADLRDYFRPGRLLDPEV